jgi:secondary thiamine-phosphate synthase enzyme
MVFLNLLDVPAALPPLHFTDFRWRALHEAIGVSWQLPYVVHLLDASAAFPPYKTEGTPVPWFQKEIQLPSFPKGCHPISRQILEALPELGKIRIGLLHVFVKHTSASLTINENADPDVLVDLDRVMDTLAEENFPYYHREEGPDDMPAHVKSSLFGSSLTIPIRDGQLVLGTWQGICLCEHRRQASRRRIVLTMQGE